MANRMMHSGSTDAFRYQGGPYLLALGMWMRSLIVGALAFVGGIAQLVVGEGTHGLAAAFVIGGAALAVAAWWRTSVLLDEAQGKQRTAKDGKPAVPIGGLRIASLPR